MILGIDAGNTNISFGIFDLNFNLLHTFNLKTERNRTAFEFLTFLETTFNHFNINFRDIIKVKIASVVPEIERELCELFINIYKKDTKFITASDVPVEINLQNPLEVGIDRIINVFSALKFYGTERHVLVIDFGTAITFDVGLKNFIYDGGIIFPGINLSLEALKSGTSKLPKVSLKEPQGPVGKSTSEAINSGIFYGYTSMVNGVVKTLQNEYQSEFNIIITGGFGEVLKNYFDFNFNLDYNIIMKGISIL